jgi:ubiquinone/menaquinone biosynthesis C-methylase UbiE
MINKFKKSRRTVPSCYYDTKYWLTDNEGYEGFTKSSGRQLTPRLKKSFELGNIKKDMLALDLGFGRGELLINCAFCGCTAIGLQPSNDGVKLAKEAIKTLPVNVKKKIILMEGDGCDLPFKDKLFDRVFMIDVAEELYPEELKEALTEVNRVLKDDGLLIIHTMPNKLRLDIGYRYYLRFINKIVNPFAKKYFQTTLHTEKVIPRSYYDNIMHINEQSYFSLKKFLKDANFIPKVWLNDSHIKEKDIKILLYHILSPRIGPLKLIFADNIWAIARPKGRRV